MAAHNQVSSSSSSSSGSSYEVFLSFHGKDVRTMFADHLYHALTGAGIRTFRDENELPKGNEIALELLTAIRQSKISIPIFSKNYTSSKWCLNELNEIFECRRTMNQIVFPIFYKVEPRDVRNQKWNCVEAFKEPKESFIETTMQKLQNTLKEVGKWVQNLKQNDVEAFQERQESFDETTIRKWQIALKEIGKLDGWHMEEDTYEGKLIKKVVKTISIELNKRLSIVSNNLVGMQSHIEKMLMLLDIKSDDRKIVGIHGPGGIGKTTIARVVFYEVLGHFEGYSFMENIRENAQKHGIHYLQNQLINDILKQKSQNISDVTTGIKIIQERFRQRKVLIILDDVDKNIHVKSIVGDRKWFGVGSKIIITSRNEHIIDVQDVDGIYKPEVMNSDDSLQLFNHHAFRGYQPLEDYLDLSKAIVKTTGGLPLALQVIGSSLCKKEKPFWKGMLKRLEKCPNEDVMARLKISYDELTAEEQQMFLDISCFFVGMDKNIACYIWEGCEFFPKVGLDSLCTNSLVTIGEDGQLRMHDMLRNLGRDIVRRENIQKPGMRSRIWSQEEVLDVLVNKTGPNNCEGLSIDFRKVSRSQCLMSEGFAAMTNLRLLQLDYAQLIVNFTNSSSELRWLSWRGCTDQYGPTNFCPKKLVVLDLSDSKITENWMGWKYIKKGKTLKVLNLTSCHGLHSTPDISANRLLEVLILKDCRNLFGIDKSIGYLKNLVTLDMSDCHRLEEIPSEISQLTSLERLHLSGELKKLPEKLSRMRSLRELHLKWCKSLVELQNETCLPSSLTNLHVWGCDSIQYISTLPSSLTNLHTFNCDSIEYISSLPSGLTNLRVEACLSIQQILGLPSGLNSLSVYFCDSIPYISDLPSSLSGLHVICCQSLSKLSSTSGGLRNLKTLLIDECNGLDEIEGVDEKLMESLESFCIRGCRSLKKLPKLKGSKNLRTIELERNDVISDFEGEGMDSLEGLEIGSCHSLKKIPYMRDSKRLRTISIRDCPELSEIKGLEEYESLEELSISGARWLKTLPDISTLKNLRRLRICECYWMERLPGLSNLTELKELYTGVDKWEKNEDWESLTEIPGLDRLESSLEKLEIMGCTGIQKLPDLSNFKRLKHLQIEGCKNLMEIHGIDKLGSSEELEIPWCESWERSPPHLSNLKYLWSLTINGCCKNPTQIPGIGRMEILKELKISCCESLERLPEMSNFRKLKSLQINGCKILNEIDGVKGLEFLEKLEITECESLERLPDLSTFRKLYLLRIKGCKILNEIHCVDTLESLQDLTLIGCESLEILPDLSTFRKLNFLGIEGCKILNEIHCVDSLESLLDLSLIGCESLEILPNLSNFKNLENLSIRGCKILKEIHGVGALRSIWCLDISGCKSLEIIPDFSNWKHWMQGCLNHYS